MTTNIATMQSFVYVLLLRGKETAAAYRKALETPVEGASIEQFQSALAPLDTAIRDAEAWLKGLEHDPAEVIFFPVPPPEDASVESLRHQPKMLNIDVIETQGVVLTIDRMTILVAQTNDPGIGVSVWKNHDLGGEPDARIDATFAEIASGDGP